VVKALRAAVSCCSIIRPRPVSGCSGMKTMIKSGKQAKIKGGLAESPSHLMHRALQLALDIYAEEAGPDGLTQRQFAVLEAVAARSRLTQTDRVKAAGIDRSTLADLVARMTTKGLLERERSTLDARAKAVRLSPEGEAALLAARPRVEAAEDRKSSCRERVWISTGTDSLKEL